MTSWEFALSLTLFTLGFIEIQTQSLDKTNPQTSDINKPRLYEKGPCTTLGLFEYYVGITTTDCLHECQRRTMCQSVNYNPFNKLCALRDRIDFGTDKPAADWCYNINMTNTTSQADHTSGLVGPCKDGPCDNTSVCLDLERIPYYTCKKAYCMSETDVQNAYFRIGSPTAVGKRNELVCQQGYMSIGSSSRECLPSGNWSESCFSCVKYCHAIPAKSTASVTSWSTYRFVENTTATFVCKEGFYNITERKIVCDKNGDWSKFDCVPYCRQKDLSPLPNGYPLPGDNYTIYDHAEYACDADFYLSPGSSKVTCNVTGKWSQPEVMCYPFCKQLDIPTVQNGRPTAGTMYNFSMTAEYECDSGYYLSPGSPYIKCDSNGKWSQPEVTCYPFCKQTDIPAVQKCIPTAGTMYNFSMTAEFECDDGYYLSPGSPFIKCDFHGKWSQPEVTCYPFCKQLDIPTVQNGGPKAGTMYNFSMTAEYECDSGYYLSPGSPYIRCDSNGKWSMPEVKCFLYCHQPESVNGYIYTPQQGQFKENESLQYSCSDGYYPASGQTGNAICLNTGEWTSYSTECYKHCNDAPSIDHANIESYSSSPLYKVKDIVKYECHNDYHLSGSDGEKVCEKDGNWNGEVTCCERCKKLIDGTCDWDMFGDCIDYIADLITENLYDLFG